MVVYAEYHGSPQEHWSAAGFTATRQLMCEWNDRAELQRDLYYTAYPYIAGTTNAAWAGGTTYDADDYVKYGADNWTYVSLYDDNTGNTPGIVDLDITVDVGTGFDPSGHYTPVADIESEAAWKHETEDIWVRWYDDITRYVISDTDGAIDPDATQYWVNDIDGEYLGHYSPPGETGSVIVDGYPICTDFRWWQYVLSNDAYALSFSASPIPAKNRGVLNVADYEKCLLTVEYGILTYDGADIGLTTAYDESLEPTAEFLTLDAIDYQWDIGKEAAALKENEAPGKLMKGLVYTKTLYNQTSIPNSYITNIGTVNSAPIIASKLGLSFDAETLLWDCPVFTKTTLSNGTGTWTIALRFIYKPQGWNVFWRGSEGIWSKIYKKNTNDDVVVYEIGTW